MSVLDDELDAIAKGIMAVVMTVGVCVVALIDSCRTNLHTVFKSDINGYQVRYEEWPHMNKLAIEKGNERYELFDTFDFRSVTNSDSIDSVVEKVISYHPNERDGREYSLTNLPTCSLESAAFQNVLSNATVKYNNIRSQIRDIVKEQPMLLEAVE